ncbi:MAG: 2-nitropropane dioxygenase [Candidatus Lambdaproteobacteria bacterium RIFOXYD1_FULL_56_27]|uniref:2-nitropropane dioxygenase n=1 Tax=Candidatus Lambdaproteobacteria bacterium RIFOXYD2_FULL_56_26 TaxID=1817773 RepID=A0A1F6GSJ5_9PROT|nr:MAG: 2-nitropropane dioxygenase [Candidatus Lambdaproteobacteria bacterium RIFOXYD2_FULL_56_26]OGH01372.1 MAG: 2-nitropropane dioxygenase [Candidatus Lambdaproteobacteria bacterium RIFOXYC1_FULL_56_13]OGH06913.1 MAG: 2-nitropropane dioxygenase [Candidatus Lambdaproteobacteria bacterium RIFOXYD1_FULL_56_27]
MTDHLDNYRLTLGENTYLPIMVGGMGMDISTSKLALEAARQGGIAHISDALISAVSDKHYGTNFLKTRQQKYQPYISQNLANRFHAQFDLDELYQASRLLVENTMHAKTGTGGIFINIMEKLTMANPRATLEVRLKGVMDAGIDGITLSAGLHLGSMALIADHPRFRQIKLGLIVSSKRALELFVKKTARLNRPLDYVVVEGPLAGGHLGFKIDDWFKFDLAEITKEVIDYTKTLGLNIPVIPAGGIFTGGDATRMLQMGAAAVQVATRFTTTLESGFPMKVQQRFFRSKEEEVVVNLVSPTGYPMRMLNDSPCIGTSIRPNCETLGFILDGNGDCSYIDAYNQEVLRHPDNPKVMDKTCLCTYMKSYGTWTCGHMVYRLKDTTNQLPDGSFQQLTVAQVFHDYLHGDDQHIKPALMEPHHQPALTTED